MSDRLRPLLSRLLFVVAALCAVAAIAVGIATFFGVTQAGTASYLLIGGATVAVLLGLLIGGGAAAE